MIKSSSYSQNSSMVWNDYVPVSGVAKFLSTKDLARFAQISKVGRFVAEYEVTSRIARGLPAKKFGMDENSLNNCLKSNKRKISNLNVDGMRFTDLDQLLTNCGKLTCFSAKYCGLTNKDVASISAHPNTQTMEFLGVSGNSIGDAAAKAIAENQKHLKTLHVEDSHIGSEGVISISRMGSLTTLHVGSSRKLEERAHAALDSMTWLSQLWR